MEEVQIQNFQTSEIIKVKRKKKCLYQNHIDLSSNLLSFNQYKTEIKINWDKTLNQIKIQVNKLSLSKITQWCIACINQNILHKTNLNWKANSINNLNIIHRLFISGRIVHWKSYCMFYRFKSKWVWLTLDWNCQAKDF